MSSPEDEQRSRIERQSPSHWRVISEDRAEALNGVGGARAVLATLTNATALRR